MTAVVAAARDLTPPPFVDGLCDWSRGDGTPPSPSYEASDTARIMRDDPDFGTCLEIRKVEPVQRLRYRGELPIRFGAAIQVRARLKALRGPLPSARIAAWPGGLGGRGFPDLPRSGPLSDLPSHGVAVELRAVIGRRLEDGPDLLWDQHALYGHVGLDLVGPCGGVVLIENLQVCEILSSSAAALPGFERL